MEKHLVANRLLTAWNDLGLKPGDALAAAADTLAAIGYAEAPLVPFDPSAATTGNAEELVTEHALRLATIDSFKEAKAQALAAAGNRVLLTAGEVLPDVLVQLQPRLIAASEALAAALELLPDHNPTPEVLVNAGPSALEAFQSAQAAIAELDALDRFAASMGAIFGHQGEVALRLLTVTTREDFQTILRAKDKQGSLRPLWVTAVTTPGVVFAINTPAQSKEIRRVLDSLPPTEHKKPVFLKLGA
jgi:hypothetical protein